LSEASVTDHSEYYLYPVFSELSAIPKEPVLGD